MDPWTLFGWLCAIIAGIIVFAMICAGILLVVAAVMTLKAEKRKSFPKPVASVVNLKKGDA